ncbi:MAG TPA: molybdate ABC transporter substrate-binding protein [Verrucomicrobiae bacterium]|nr:molybdate ABC transporter substrate-binding protein [Verrucomicrobiae bacterium]
MQARCNNLVIVMRRHKRHTTRAAINASWLIVPLSIVAILILALLLFRHPGGRITAGGDLVVFCAAGIKPPTDATATDYQKEYGSPIQLQYGGSGTLLNNLRISHAGDIYIAADESYIRLARERGLIAETLPLARQHPVIAVRKGNPKGIRSLDDLRRDGVAVALANPEAASIGKLTKDTLDKLGRWTPLAARVKVFKPTVGDVANDVKLGSVDAGIVWDSTVRQYPELEAVASAELEPHVETVTLAILKSSKHPTAALRFARYLAASDRGLRHFKAMGYTPVEGDAWAETPELVLFSGAVNRVAVEDAIKAFEEREGARITRVYNGCGILVAQMKAGGRPDAYLTCDESFVPPVADLFDDGLVRMSETDIVIVAPKGNPKNIRTLQDLARPGLRIGITNPEQSTLGALTQSLLSKAGIRDQVLKNVVTMTPTADMLLNETRTGALDAAVVYIANANKARDHLEISPLKIPGSVAVQTFSVAKNSKHKQLVGRLLEALRTAEQDSRYEAAGFRARHDR